MPTPSAVLNAAHKLSAGYRSEAGLGDLIVVDVGGATTDVHSIGSGEPTRSGVMLKGLPEPGVKRTVEGDLGVRYSAAPLVEAAGIHNLVKSCGLNEQELMQYVDKIKANPEILPAEGNKLDIVDFGLTSAAIRLAVDRHAGRITTEYTPFGAVYIQTGKDLTGFKTIIGTGGPVINGINPKEILREASYDSSNPVVLKPNKAEFLLDRKYILAAMGLLCEKYPEIAIRIMKKELSAL